MISSLNHGFLRSRLLSFQIFQAFLDVIFIGFYFISTVVRKHTQYNFSLQIWDFLHDSGYVLSWQMFCVHLKGISNLQYQMQLRINVNSITLVNKVFQVVYVLADFLLIHSIFSEKEVLKSTSVAGSYVFPLLSVNICFNYFETLLLGTYFIRYSPYPLLTLPWFWDSTFTC